jgi:hypothetical protein
MKNRRYIAILITVFISTGATGCLHRGENEKQIIKKDVMIKECAVNDLGQVLVFVTDKDNREWLFIRDFYSREKSGKLVSLESSRYLNKVKRLRNRRVTIVYFENYAGNREIEKIIE